MHLCIYGPLGLNMKFGGILHDSFPTEKPAFGFHCSPPAIDQSLQKQWIVYTATQLDLARGLIT